MTQPLFQSQHRRLPAIDGDQIEAAAEEGVRGVPLDLPASGIDRQGVLDGHGVLQRHDPAREPRAQERRGLAGECRPRFLRQGMLGDQIPCEGRQPIERRPSAGGLGLADVRLDERVGHRAEQAGPLVRDRLRESQDVLEPVGRRAPVPGLEAGGADPREPVCVHPDGGRAHDGVTSRVGVVMVLFAADRMSRPDSRRKREGGRNATSPQRRRIRATEHTSR